MLPHYERTNENIIRPYLIPLTSHSETAGKLLVDRFADYLGEHDDVSVQSFAHTLSTRRSMHDQRTFVTGATPAELRSALEDIKQDPAWTSERPVQRRVAFSFSGQGAQYPKMAVELIDQCHSFKHSMLRCESILSQLPDGPDWSLIGELRKEKATSKVNQPERSQPLCTAIQLGIVDLLVSWGVKPSACVGHSSGEMAAAYAAGILTFETALVYSYYRGLYANKNRPEALPTPSAMMAIGMGPLEAEEILRPFNGKLSIAAVNSPTSCTISGDEDAIVKLKHDLIEKKMFARQLVVQIGYHSHHMKVFTETYKRSMEHCQLVKPPQKGNCRMFSSVTARVARSVEMGPQYWVDNMNGTVRFSDALTGILLDELDRQNVDMLIEIGPHTALKSPTYNVMKSINTEVPYIATLTRGEHAYHALLKTAGNLFKLGYPIDFTIINEGENAQRLTNLPGYAWDHKSYWAATRIVKEELLKERRHSILGFPIPGWTHHSQRWRNYLRASELAWMNDHQIQGHVVFPAAGYLSMILDAVLFTTPTGSVIKDVQYGDIVIASALTLPHDDSGREVIVELTARLANNNSKLASSYDFHISSFDDSEQCVDNCHGWIQVNIVDQKAGDIEKQQLATLNFPPLPTLNQTIDHDRFYEKLSSYGLEYGEQFRLCMHEIQCGDNVCVANVVSENQNPSAEFMTINPSILDACLHPVFAAFEAHLEHPLAETFVPSTFKSLRIPGRTLHTLNRGAKLLPQSFEALALTGQPGPRRVNADIYVRTQDTKDVVMEMLGLEAVSLGDTSSTSKRSVYSRIQWKPSIRFLGGGDSIIPSMGRLQDMLDLYIHERPKTSILYIGNDVPTFEREWRSCLGGGHGERRRYEKLYIATNTNKSTTTMSTDAPNVEMGLPDEYTCGLVIVDKATKLDVGKYLTDDGLVIKKACTDAPSESIFKYFDSQDLQCWRKIVSSPSGNKLTNSTLAVIASSSPSSRVLGVVSCLKASYPGSIQVHDLDKLTKKIVEVLPTEVVVLSNIDDDVFLHDCKEDKQRFESCRRLLTGSGRRVVWVTEGATFEPVKAHHALALGLIRTARSENELSDFITLDVSSSCVSRRLARLIGQALNPENTEDELADRNGTICIPRMIMDDSLNSRLEDGFGRVPKPEAFKQDRHMQVKADTLDREDFVFEERCVGPIGDDEIEIQVMAASLTIEPADASEHTNAALAPVDYAGYVKAKGKDVSKFKMGEKVLAWMPVQQAICNVVRAHASMCISIGSETFSQAVNWCSDMTKAYHALVDVARIRRGDHVWVLSAESTLGQLTVKVANYLGAEVLAVCDSTPPPEFIDNLGLQKSQVLLSQMLTSHEISMPAIGATAVVINTVPGHLEQVAWGAFAANSHIIDLTCPHEDTLTSLRQRLIRSAIRYSPVDLSAFASKQNNIRTSILMGALQARKIMCLPERIHEYPISQASDALKTLRTEQTVNKVVLTVSEDNRECVLALPQAFGHDELFDKNKTYLLVGGLGGLGITVAEWMGRKGAKKLAFFSRSGAKGSVAKQVMARLEAQGIKVHIFKGDLGDFGAVQACVQSIGSSLAGVFQMAGIYHDAPLHKMSFEQWRHVLAPKVTGTTNLSDATADINLDFFVAFASLSGIVGNKGQANYSAANCYIDALMRQRRSRGLPGFALDIGMVLNAGVVSGDSNLRTTMERNGMDYVAEHELYRQLETSVKESSSSETTNSRGIDAYQICSGGRLLSNNNFRARKPIYAALVADLAFEEGESDLIGGVTKDLHKLLSATKGDSEKQAILQNAFIDKLALLCGISPESIDAASSLAKYGLDSLLAVDIRNWLLKQIKVDLPLFAILGAKSIRGLVGEAAANVIAAASADTNEQAEGNEGNAASKTAGLDAELEAVERPEHIPLSTYQDRMWFLHHFLDDKTNLNLRITSWMTGEPKVAAMEAAFRELKHRNEIFRTAFIQYEGFAEQSILDDCSFELPYYDFLNEDNPNEAVEHLSLRMHSKELDLGNGETFRAAIAKTGHERFACVLIFHHMVIDRGSFDSMLSQMAAYYDDAVLEIKNSEELDTGVQYADFSNWHNRHLQSAVMRPSIEFWKEELADSPATSPLLPFAKRERGRSTVIENAAHITMLDTKLLARMKRICASMEMTPFQYLMAAFRTFYYRYTQATDLVIHVVDGNRPHAAVARTIGFFSNVIPVRLATQFDCGFEAILKDTKAKMLKAVEHSGIPFDAIVDETHTRRVPGVFPLGQVIINYQIHGEMPKVPARDFILDGYDHEDIPTACEINLEALENHQDGLKLRLEHRLDLYSAEDMECFAENFLEFLSSTIKDHRQPVSEIAMVGGKERSLLQSHVQPVLDNVSNSATIVEQILQQAQANGEKTAISTSDGKSMTYSELADAAQHVASSLVREGAKPDHHIGLLAYPGLFEVIGILGIVMCRCGYVPMDPSFGRERLTFMAEDSGCSIIIIDDNVESILYDNKGKATFTQKMVPISQAMRGVNKKTYEGHEGADPFFITYTSGSTGKPKGVVLTHTNVLAMVNTLASEYSFSDDDVFLHQSSMAFDLSLPQIINALMCGGTCCIPTIETKQDPFLLADFMETSGITFTYFVPTQFAMLLDANKKALKACNTWRIGFFAGEVVPSRLIQAVYDLGTPTQAYSTWGPCEAVTQLTIHRVPNPVPSGKVLLGRPTPSCQAYVLDPMQNLVPRGVLGELYGCGPQVAGAYLNRPEASAVSFPLNPYDGGRMLRTGDTGWMDTDGAFHFAGRVAGDQMIKLRGFRVDLGEIEQRIFDEGAHTGSQQVANVSAVARMLDDGSGGKSTWDISDNRQIIVFIVLRKQYRSQAQEFVQRLHDRLPKALNRFMIPAGYDFLEALPSTIGGKVDIQSLLERPLNLVRPGTKSSIRKTAVVKSPTQKSQPEAKFAPTSSLQGAERATFEFGELKEAVLDQFRTVLDYATNEEIGPEDSFFDLGGNSMLLPRLQSRLKTKLDTKITVAQIFNAPTPAGITDILASEVSTRIPTTSVSPTRYQAATLPTDMDSIEHLRPSPRSVSNFSNKGGIIEPDNKTVAHFNGNKTMPIKEEVDWTEEVYLPSDSRYQIPENDDLGPSHAPDTLVLGVDTFHGIHFLAEYLGKSTGMVHLIGVKQKVTHESIITSLAHFNLLDESITPELVKLRTKAHHGTCSDFHFGLSTSTFARLGARVHSIYNLGASTSQVETYSQLWAANVRPIYDIIELASCGDTPSAIHHFSTWSVPHLQTWSNTRRTRKLVSAAEEPATHFAPSPTQRPGYIKTRWVGEILLTQAAARGFPVTLFRASAMSGSRKTSVPAPREGIIQQLIVAMLQTGRIPEVEGFVVDFVPVDFVVSGMIELTYPPTPYCVESEKLAIRHLTNPEPLSMRRLQKMMPNMTFCSSEAWLDAVLNDVRCTRNEGDAARWAAIGGYFKEGHNQFALDNEETMEALERAGGVARRCPPVDRTYLKTLLRDWEGQGDGGQGALDMLEGRLCSTDGLSKAEKRKSYGLSLLGVASAAKA